MVKNVGVIRNPTAAKNSQTTNNIAIRWRHGMETGLLWGESTGDPGYSPSPRASIVKFWYNLYCYPHQVVEQTWVSPVIYEAMTAMGRPCMLGI